MALLADLDAFYLEYRRCGEQGAVAETSVWLTMLLWSSPNSQGST